MNFYLHSLVLYVTGWFEGFVTVLATKTKYIERFLHFVDDVAKIIVPVTIISIFIKIINYN